MITLLGCQKGSKCYINITKKHVNLSTAIAEGAGGQKFRK